MRRDSGWMKSGCVFVEFEQLVREGRELEEVILFGDGFGGAAAIGAGVAGLGVVDIEVVEDAVLAGVAAFIDIAVLAAALEQILHHARVARIGGALKVVDLEAEQSPTAAGIRRRSRRQNSLRRFAGALGGALHILRRARRCRW